LRGPSCGRIIRHRVCSGAQRVKRSLYSRAVGYNYEAVKIFMPANREKRLVADDVLAQHVLELLVAETDLKAAIIILSASGLCSEIEHSSGTTALAINVRLRFNSTEIQRLYEADDYPLRKPE
jgi:hypothetical protein